MTERFLQVVRGDPTPEELAALVTVLTARARASREAAEPEQRRSAWSAPARRLRRALPHGPDAWRSGSLPS